jgi:hypothetical protein
MKNLDELIKDKEEVLKILKNLHSDLTEKLKTANRDEINVAIDNYECAIEQYIKALHWLEEEIWNEQVRIEIEELEKLMNG